jgi:hypothetical protein
LAECKAQAPPTPWLEKKVAMPRWVRVTAAGGATARVATATIRLTGEAGDRPAYKTILDVGSLVCGSVAAARANRPLLTGRGIPRSTPLKIGGGVLLTAASLGVGAATGDLTTNNASQHGVSLAASAVAAPLTYAGMLWFAGAVGTASTGTAIGTLSGAAFTSSATAFWGGGAVAAGGGGVAVGSYILTGGAVAVAVAAGYGAVKLWNIYDPAEREGFLRLSEGLSRRADLTDATTAAGSALVAHKRATDAVERSLRR